MGGTRVFTTGFEPLSRMTLYLPDEIIFGDFLGAAWLPFDCGFISQFVKEQNCRRPHKGTGGGTRGSDPEPLQKQEAKVASIPWPGSLLEELYILVQESSWNSRELSPMGNARG